MDSGLPCQVVVRSSRQITQSDAEAEALLGSAFPSSKRNPVAVHDQGQRIVDEILNDPSRNVNACGARDDLVARSALLRWTGGAFTTVPMEIYHFVRSLQRNEKSDSDHQQPS